MAKTQRVASATPMFDPYAALARTLEREAALLLNLRELLFCVDTSEVGPASSVIPRWQLERIESAIEMSEEETALLEPVLQNLGRDGNP